MMSTADRTADRIKALTLEEALKFQQALISLPETHRKVLPCFGWEWGGKQYRKVGLKLPLTLNGLADAFAEIECFDIAVGAVLIHPTDYASQNVLDPGTAPYYLWTARFFVTDQIPSGTAYMLGLTGSGELLQTVEWTV